MKLSSFEYSEIHVSILQNSKFFGLLEHPWIENVGFDFLELSNAIPIEITIFINHKKTYKRNVGEKRLFSFLAVVVRMDKKHSETGFIDEAIKWIALRATID